jgi:hypothetical protein
MIPGAGAGLSINIVTVNFKKIVAFKGMIRKLLNMVAVHIESPYLKLFYRVSVL